MSSIFAPGASPRVRVSPDALPLARVALILGITVLVALAIYHFVGVDEGAVSAFGKTMAARGSSCLLVRPAGSNSQ